MPNQTGRETAKQPTCQQPPWLTFEEMRQVLRVSRPTLRALVASGAVHASKVGAGKEYRFAPDEPARYFATTQVKRIA